MATISEFKGNMTEGGARPNQFKIQLNFPLWVNNGITAGQTTQFLCKASSLPASIIENIGIHYRGRQVNFAGERTFQPWTMTIYNDNNFLVRDAFERWQTGVQNYTATNGILNPIVYQTQLNAYQLDRNDRVVKHYVLIDAYPTVVSDIKLDFDAQNQIETFDVEFHYNYFVSNSTDSAIGGAVGGGILGAVTGAIAGAI